jgi:hypothetical protein
MKSFNICIQNSDQIKKDEMDGTRDMYRGEKTYIQGFGGEPQKRRPLGKSRLILKIIFKKRYGWTWTEFIWLRIGTSGGLLSIR